MEDLERSVNEHPFLSGLEEGFLKAVCGCAKNVLFEARQYLFHEGESANEFYLIRHGRVAFEIRAPGRTLVFQTLRDGEIAGISWLIPPYRWTYDARAIEPTHAIALNAVDLRAKCEADHDFGYAMMKRFVPVLIQRLQAARLQILDVYGNHV